MKKILLSSFVVLAFTIYAVHYRLDDAKEAKVVAPKSASLPPTSLPGKASNSTQKPATAPTTKFPGLYKDGEYVGDITDAYYGNVQVKVTVQDGKITDVLFLDYPQDRETSQMINSQAIPILRTETIQAQSSNVDVVSGATETSGAFIKSLESALVKART